MTRTQQILPTSFLSPTITNNNIAATHKQSCALTGFATYFPVSSLRRAVRRACLQAHLHQPEANARCVLQRGCADVHCSREPLERCLLQSGWQPLGLALYSKSVRYSSAKASKTRALQIGGRTPARKATQITLVCRHITAAAPAAADGSQRRCCFICTCVPTQ